jgi:three-Cys-motif partner protein
MGVPAEYHGREQTFLKHEVLQRYLLRWAHMLSSRGKYGATRLWYVDCFAGPWNSKHPEQRDTSVAIGLAALETARITWAKKGAHGTTGAILVEQDDRAFEELEKFVNGAKGQTDVRVLKGGFGSQVESIGALLGRDPAFLFVDPTGWNGVAMDYIAPLVRRSGRDVLINVMYEHINRFKGDEREWLRKQMREFFDIEDNSRLRNMTEDQMLELYRTQLKARSDLQYSLNLAIPFPGRKRTYFHLVVGGHHPKVVSLFREVEHDVLSTVLPEVKEDVRSRRDQEVGQQPLFGALPIPRAHGTRLESARMEARRMVLDLLQEGPMRYDAIWPAVMERYPLRATDLKHLVLEMVDEQAITVAGRKKRERTIKDNHTLAFVPPPHPNPASG